MGVVTGVQLVAQMRPTTTRTGSGDVYCCNRSLARRIDETASLLLFPAVARLQQKFQLHR
jgi:hypothetical protein